MMPSARAKSVCTTATAQPALYSTLMACSRGGFFLNPLKIEKNNEKEK
jgi:hypothetical protein